MFSRVSATKRIREEEKETRDGIVQRLSNSKEISIQGIEPRRRSPHSWKYWKRQCNKCTSTCGYPAVNPVLNCEKQWVGGDKARKKETCVYQRHRLGRKRK
ncbi:uncharacterized protein [Polyergus mexicanus]|uniref:uncharacterized protein n=1 Tax=Polyergus mexicanus TaxID=615972 RepID=UPI0038B5C0DE